MTKIRSQTPLGWVLVLMLASCATTTTFRNNSESADSWMCARVPGGKVECIDLREYRRGACPATSLDKGPKPLEL